jgi:hypothetical protein
MASYTTTMIVPMGAGPTNGALAPGSVYQSPMTTPTQLVASGTPDYNVIGHYITRMLTGVLSTNGEHNQCFQCKEPLGEQDYISVTMIDPSKPGEVVQLIDPNEGLASHRWPASVRRERFFDKRCHLNCWASCHANDLHNNAVRVLIPPVVEEDTATRQGMDHATVVAARHWSKLQITSAYDDIGVLEVEAVAPDIKMGSARGKPNSAEYADRDYIMHGWDAKVGSAQAQVMTAYIMRVHLHLAPLVPVRKEALPFRQFTHLFHHIFIFEVKTNNNVNIGEQRSNIINAVAEAAGEAMRRNKGSLRCNAFSYIHTTINDGMTSLTVHRVLVSARIADGPLDTNYKQLFLENLFHKSGVTNDIVDWAKLFADPNPTGPLDMPLVEEKYGPDPSLQSSAHAMIRFWLSRWDMMRQFSQNMFLGLEKDLLTRLNMGSSSKREKMVTLLKHLVVSDHSTSTHQIPELGPVKVWSLFVNTQRMEVNYDMPDNNPDLYYCFGADSTEVIAFRFNTAQAGVYSNQAPPYLPILFEDSSTLQNEQRLRGLVPHDMQALFPIPIQNRS